MSLLDDVSLMITPNGVAEDVLFGVLPTPTIGTPVTINPTFDTTTPIGDAGSGWEGSVGGSSTVAYSDGGVKLTRDGGVCKLRVRNAAGGASGMTVGLTYKLVYDVVENNTNALLRFWDGAAQTVVSNSIGTHTYYFTQISTITWQIENYNDATNITLDNVYIYPYLSSDMDFTRATTATYVNYADTITSAASGVPRLDYTGASCPHILVEPQRTNYAQYSEDFSGTGWALTGGGSGQSITTNSTTAPDGTTTADTLTAGTGTAQVQRSFTGTSGADYTGSIWIKRKTGTGQVYIRVGDNVSTPITITSEWVRYEHTDNVSSTVVRIGVKLDVSGDEVYLWGAQLEEGSYKTSYIPAVAGANVTRNAETFTRTGIGDLIGTAGVLYLEVAALGSDVQDSIALSDGTTNNRVLFYYTTTGTIAFQIKVGGSSVASGSQSGYTETDFHKIAIRYQDDSFQMFIDGVKKNDIAGTWTVPAFDRLAFDAGATGGGGFEGKVRNLQVYKTALTEAKCISLTS